MEPFLWNEIQEFMKIRVFCFFRFLMINDSPARTFENGSHPSSFFCKETSSKPSPLCLSFLNPHRTVQSISRTILSFCRSPVGMKRIVFILKLIILLIDDEEARRKCWGTKKKTAGPVKMADAGIFTVWRFSERWKLGGLIYKSSNVLITLTTPGSCSYSCLLLAESTTMMFLHPDCQAL